MKARRGFTLIELLVVIAIIGMLVGLGIPAILAARERARTTQCADNQKNLAQALVQYDVNQGAFPGFANRVPGSYTSEAGWPVMVLKLIGREDAWNQLREYNTTTNIVPDTRVGLFICPSDSDVPTEGPSLSYVANCGQPDAGTFVVKVKNEHGQDLDEYLGTPAQNVPPDWAANGVFFRQNSGSTNPVNPSFVKVKLSADDIKDGTQHTFLISERHVIEGEEPRHWICPCPEQEKEMGFLWRQTVDDAHCEMPAGINVDPDPSQPSPYPPTVEPRDLPSSYHPGGVNITYCDGHGTFLSDQVSYQVYALQMTPNGSAAWAPGVAKSNPTNGQPPPWCRQPLNE